MKKKKHSKTLPKKKIVRKRSMKAGLAPGAAVYVGEQKAETVKITLFDYDRETCEVLSPTSVDEFEPYRQKPTVTWINIDGLHEVDFIQKIGTNFGLHPLTVEDILNTTQRPKLDIFDDYIYLVARMHTYDVNAHAITTEQVSFVLGEHFLLTFQEQEGDTFNAVRDRITKSKVRIRKMGVDYLLYALLDSIVDNYFVVLEKVGEEIESMEEELITQPQQEILQKIHTLKREMILLRKSVWPLREVVSGLQRDEIPQISESINYFLNDLYDHTVQVIDTVETFRDMISGMLDIYLSSLSNRMNEIMKVLTIFAAIFIPLTFIAGIYGMNFNPDKSPFNMPELDWYLGYPFAIGLMLIVGVGMLFHFKRKNWF